MAGGGDGRGLRLGSGPLDKGRSCQHWPPQAGCSTFSPRTLSGTHMCSVIRSALAEPWLVLLHGRVIRQTKTERKGETRGWVRLIDGARGDRRFKGGRPAHRLSSPSSPSLLQWHHGAYSRSRSGWGPSVLITLFVLDVHQCFLGRHPGHMVTLTTSLWIWGNSCHEASYFHRNEHCQIIHRFPTVLHVKFTTQVRQHKHHNNCVIQSGNWPCLRFCCLQSFK